MPQVFATPRAAAPPPSNSLTKLQGAANLEDSIFNYETPMAAVNPQHQAPPPTQTPRSAKGTYSGRKFTSDSKQQQTPLNNNNPMDNQWTTGQKKIGFAVEESLSNGDEDREEAGGK